LAAALSLDGLASISVFGLFSPLIVATTVLFIWIVQDVIKKVLLRRKLLIQRNLRTQTRASSAQLAVAFLALF
jgi:hypothetical protein